MTLSSTNLDITNNTNITGVLIASIYVGITPDMVSLGNVNNTSDALKPLSTDVIAALALKAPLASPLFTGTMSVANNINLGTTAQN